jgi:cell division protein FtsL
MLQQRMAQLPDPREMPNITLNQALHIQHNARQLVAEIRRLFYEASENYQNYRNVRIDGNPVDQDVTNMYYITSDLLNRAQVLRNNATQMVEELTTDEFPEIW